MKKKGLKTFVTVVALMLTAQGLNARDSGGADSLVGAPVVVRADFVHDTCVFDTLLPTFRQLAAFYAPPEKGSEGHAHGTCFTDYVMEVPDLARRMGAVVRYAPFSVGSLSARHARGRLLSLCGGPAPSAGRLD